MVDRPSTPSHANYIGWLAVPNIIRDRYGDEHVVGMKFRNPDAENGGLKYLYPTGQEMRLYNLRAMHGATSLIVVTEGETDAWAVTYAGLPCVAVPGANTFSAGKEEHHTEPFRLRLFEGFQRVIVLQDPDDAGARLVSEMEPIDGLEVKQMPKGIKDPSEFLVERGPDELHDYVLEHDASSEDEE